MVWHEAIAGRSAPEVASAYFNVIKNSDSSVSQFTFWADNCSAQNKNWVLFTTFSAIVNLEWGPEEIVTKYCEPGRSK